MSSERPSRALARWPRLAATGAMLSVAFSGVAGAQSVAPASCGPVKAVPVDRNYIVDARAAIGIDGGLFMVGQMAARIDRSTPTPSLDSSIVAVVGRLDGSAVGIPAPRPSMRVTDAKGIATSSTEVRVYFHSNDRFSQHAPFELWTGVVSDGRWKGLTPLGTFSNAVYLGAEVSDGPVEWRGAQVFAFAQDSGSVVLVRSRGDSTHVVRMPTSLWGVGDISLAVHDDELWMALAAGGADTRNSGDIFVGRVRDDSLKDVRRAVVGGERRLQQPRLLPTSEGLVLAWISEDPESGTMALGWRAVSEGAPEHYVPARWPIARAAHPFTHLITVPMSDRSAMVAELLPSGLRRLATIESRVLAPAIGGIGGRLFAVSWVEDPSKPGKSQLAVHDITCALPAESPPRRP